jgi:hypothetical protein
MRRVMLLGGPLDHRFVDCDDRNSEIRQSFVIGTAIGAFLKCGLPPGNPVIMEAVYYDRGHRTGGTPSIPSYEFQEIN